MPTPTRGNPLAGSLAASLAAIEVRKLLVDRAALATGRDVFFDASSYSHSVTRLERSPRCRFSHDIWSLSAQPDLSLREAFDLAGPTAEAPWLSVPEHRFVSRLECPGCGYEEEPWCLRASLDERALRCPRCAAPRPVRGFDLEDRLASESVPVALLARPLSERGLRAGEVFAVGGGDSVVRHFALEDASCDGFDIVVAGQGNIGSFLAPLLARLPGVERILLSDPDCYEADQVGGQDMRRTDAGRNKAEAQAERLRALRPELRVEALAAPIEHLPLGRLRGAIAVSCLDSLGARLALGARAWRVGSPFVDAAVGGGESLFVRTSVYLPEPDAPCFECAFDEHDYQRLDQVFPCEDART